MLVLTFSSKPITFCGCLWCASAIKVKPIIKYTRCGRRGSFTKLSLRLNFLSYREFLYLTIVDRTICYFSVLIQAKILDDIFFRSFRGRIFYFSFPMQKSTIPVACLWEDKKISVQGVYFCCLTDLPVEGLFFETFFEIYPAETPFPWLIYEGIKIYFSKKPKLFSFLWPTNEGG